MKFSRIILFPIAFLYGCIVYLRNKLYDWNVFESKKFSIPVISVGNLSMGGTGKTPHIEYLIRLLKNEFSIAILSRGYGRKTEGFILSTVNSTAAEIGDEPLQFKNKFPELPVAVDAKRVNGINKLLEQFPKLQTILLDDAFQHRAVRLGLSVVLTDYSKLYVDDFIVPSGTLREFSSGIKRADIIIVTKCPEKFSIHEREQLTTKIKPFSHQRIYFSYIRYGDFVPLFSNHSSTNYSMQNLSAVLLTGIANTTSLEHYLKDKIRDIITAKYDDHHAFTMNDIQSIKNKFTIIASENKIILTTEKDAMRLKDAKFISILKDLPLFYIPIEIDFNHNDKEEFNEQILKYVRTN
jgi:tetraacyldisaccharide 4'-kinase